MESLQQILQRLFADAPCPALMTDRTLRLFWANAAALRDYPVLSLPGGLTLLFSQSQLDEAKSTLENGDCCTLEPAGMAGVGFCFVPAEPQGIFVTAGPVGERGERLDLRSADLLTATVTNQLKTPLSGIFSALFSMARLPEAEPGGRLAELIEQISRSSYQMLRFSMDFNVYLQDATGFCRRQDEQMDLCSLLSQLGTAAGMLTGSVGIALQLHLPDHPVLILADEQRLSHALLHLISNSCRFTREGNRIDIQLEEKDGQALVSVTDAGIGIPDTVIDRVCEPFFSYDPEGMPYAGCGLGLSVVRHTVAQHGGSFAISSTEGKGVTVALSLPLAPSSRLTLKSPAPALDLLSDRFSLVHIILSDSCGTPKF